MAAAADLAGAEALVVVTSRSTSTRASPSIWPPRWGPKDLQVVARAAHAQDHDVILGASVQVAALDGDVAQGG